MATFGPADNATDIYENTAGTQGSIGGNNVWVGRSGGNVLNGGFRFTGVTIPQGATITSAVLTVYTNNSNSTPVNIHCEAVDDSAALTTSRIPSGWTKTAGASKTFTRANTGTTTAPFTAELQAVVDRTGWSNSNALGVALIGTPGAGGVSMMLEGVANVLTNAPSITVVYTAGGGGTANPWNYYAQQ